MVYPAKIQARVIVSLFLGAALFLADGPAWAEGECGKLIQQKCQSCHSLARTCAGLGRDKRQWQHTIKKMAAYDRTITRKEQKLLINCLSKQKKDVSELCRH